MSGIENMAFLKLRPVSDSKLTELVKPLLCEGEPIFQQYQGIRDGILFTDRRVIAVNTQGILGKKKEFVILPYRCVQAYSIQSAGLMDFDSEMKLWFAGLGIVTFELFAGADLVQLSRIISDALYG